MNERRELCAETGKRCYSYRGARIAISLAKRKSMRCRKMIPRREYYCEFCHTYHLSHLKHYTKKKSKPDET